MARKKKHRKVFFRKAGISTLMLAVGVVLYVSFVGRSTDFPTESPGEAVPRPVVEETTEIPDPPGIGETAEVRPPQAKERRAGLAKVEKKEGIYQLRVKDHHLARRTIQDLVSLLGGSSKFHIIDGSRPQTIRFNLLLPQDMGDYFLSKLSGLGELTLPIAGTGEGAVDETSRRVVIHIFDP